MDFIEAYKDDITALFNAIVEFVKSLIAKLSAGEEA